jgi:hypothetical protein
MILSALALVATGLMPSAWGGGADTGTVADAQQQKAIDERAARRDSLLRSKLKFTMGPDKVVFDYTTFALAAYWFNERMPEADQAMIMASQPELVRARGSGPTDETTYYRSVYNLQRVYFLFNSRSEYFPGRMSPAAEEAVAELMWQWASTACRKEMFRPECDWWQPGTENIGAILWSSLWGATQMLAEHPDYRDRHYADGTAVPEMAKVFNDYYKRFFRERASKGLLIEFNSAYNTHTLNCWYNIADFAPDPVLRKRVRMFLDLYWADWAIEQIDGVRGGSRHRCYPGHNSTISPGGGGDGASWYLFGVGHAKSMSPFMIGAATTFYRPSPVVTDLVHDVEGRGTYAYLSRRPGLGNSSRQDFDGVPLVKDRDSFFGDIGGSVMNPDGGQLLRSTWCTPDFVMGTSMVPVLPNDDWANISSQNRWEGVIFGGHDTARIFIQPIPPLKGSFYNAYWSVQSKGVMIAQRLKQAKGANGSRVWFDHSLKRQERAGWVFAEAPGAYAAVRVVEGTADWQPDHPKSGKPGPGSWLTFQQEFSPVILEVARKSDYPNFEAFQKQILANRLSWKNRKLDYTSSGYQTQLTLFADYSETPEIDGVSVNYNPEKVYDSPFIQGVFGSGVVGIRSNKRKQILDFNKE